MSFLGFLVLFLLNLLMVSSLGKGKIPYYTMPPIRNQGEPSEAKIISELQKEFNIDEVYDIESSFIGSLKSVDDLNPVEVPPELPLNFNEDLLENDEPKHSIQSDEGPKDMNNDGDDVSMAFEEDEEGRNKGKIATSRQNEKLYAVEGMLNTKMKKEEKKRRKKAEKSIPEYAIDDDYDFKVDYVKKRSAMDVGDEDDGNQIIGKVPMFGIG